MFHNKFINVILMFLVLCISSVPQVFSYCDPTNKMSDDPMAIEAEYSQNNQVFIGEVSKIEPLSGVEKVNISSDRIKVIFKIEKQYKGEEAQQISLFEFSGGYYHNSYYVPDMPLVFEIGHKYLVYAKGGYGQIPLQTGLSCSRTRVLSEAAKDIAILEKIASNPKWKFDDKGYQEWRKSKN